MPDWFVNNWLPNIVCGLAGCLLSWLIGFRQGKRAEVRGRKQIILLQNIERKGAVEFIRDEEGDVVDARVVRFPAYNIQSGVGIITPEGGDPKP